MTSYSALKSEAERLTARLAFTTDPQHQRILRTAIADLVDTLKAYPAGLVWVAEYKGRS